MPTRSSKRRTTKKNYRLKKRERVTSTRRARRITRRSRRRHIRKLMGGGEGDSSVQPLPYATVTTGESPRTAAYNEAQNGANTQNVRNNLFKGGFGRRRYIKGGNSGKIPVPQFGQANPESNQASVLLNQTKVNAANSAKYDSAAYV